MLKFNAYVTLKTTGQIEEIEMTFGGDAERKNSAASRYFIDETHENIARILAWEFTDPNFRLYGLHESVELSIRRHFGFPMRLGYRFMAFDKNTRIALSQQNKTMEYETCIVEEDGSLRDSVTHLEFEDALNSFKERVNANTPNESSPVIDFINHPLRTKKTPTNN